MSALLFKPKNVSGLNAYYALTSVVKSAMVSAGSAAGSYVVAAAKRINGLRNFGEENVKDVARGLVEVSVMVERFESNIAAKLFVAAEEVWRRFRTAFMRSAYGSMLPSPTAFIQYGGKGVDRKILVLDLDETLVHSHYEYDAEYDALLEVRRKDSVEFLCVNFRPYLDLFLRSVGQWYDVYIYTSGLREYADPLINMIDVCGVVKGRLFRNNCVPSERGFMKDLTRVEKDMRKVLIVDNSPIAYSLQKTNAVPIATWVNDSNDEGLLNLLPMLESLKAVEDVRSVLALRTLIGEYL